MFIPNTDRFYNDFENYISQTDKAAAEEKLTINEEDIDKLFDLIKDDPESQYTEFRTAMKEMQKIQGNEEEFNKIKEDMTIYQVLSSYLVKIFSYCSYSFYREYFLLVYMITKSINDKGDKFIDKEEKNSIKDTAKDNLTERLFAETDFLHVIPEILNLFIAELFPEKLKEFKGSKNIEFKYLGFEDENIKNLILMCKYMANWLFNHEFTEYRLEINVDF